MNNTTVFALNPEVNRTTCKLRLQVPPAFGYGGRLRLRSMIEGQMLELDIDTTAKLAAPFITLIGGVLIRYFTEGRPRIVSFIGHVSAFALQDEQKTKVFTHNIVVRNTGTKAAKNVRLGHNVFPQNITISPSVQYSVETSPEGNSEIVIPTLVPKEQVTISYLSFRPSL